MPERLRHQFVDYLPERLENDVLYLALRFGTVAHNCCCGCGNEVVTPLSPTDWQLTFDGESISLAPSIGNWNLPCRSHYFITKSRVLWAKPWTRTQIERGRSADRQAREQYYLANEKRRSPWWTKVKRWWR
jgi:hypothetical protein